MTRQNQAFRPWGACLPQPGSRATPIVDCVWEVVRLTQKPTVKPHAARGTHTSGKEDYNPKWRLGQGGILALNVEEVPSNLQSGSEFPATYYFRLPPEGPTLAPERPKPDGFWRSLDGFWVEHPEVKPPLGHLTEPGSTEVEGPEPLASFRLSSEAFPSERTSSSSEPLPLATLSQIQRKVNRVTQFFKVPSLKSCHLWECPLLLRILAYMWGSTLYIP